MAEVAVSPGRGGINHLLVTVSEFRPSRAANGIDLYPPGSASLHPRLIFAAPPALYWISNELKPINNAAKCNRGLLRVDSLAYSSENRSGTMCMKKLGWFSLTYECPYSWTILCGPIYPGCFQKSIWSVCYFSFDLSKLRKHAHFQLFGWVSKSLLLKSAKKKTREKRVS